MNKFDRIYDLYRILRDRRTPIPINSLTDRLECSQPTVKRSIQKLRDEFGAPIRAIRGRGYLLDNDGRDGMFELPGLWFNASELRALLTAHHLLEQVEPGVLGEEIEPLRRRIRTILQNRRAGDPELMRRVNIVTSGSRTVDKHRFRQACTALLRRRRLEIRYHARGTDQMVTREISPQRLTHYRSNWYLVAWCHLRDGLRNFALERIDQIHPLQTEAMDISDQEIAASTSAYGIFAGPSTQRAILRFTPERARWLAEEQWHPEQTGQWLPDGRYEITLPYDNPTELIMDTLRYGPDVEVVSPDSLRQAVLDQLQATLESYEQPE